MGLLDFRMTPATRMGLLTSGLGLLANQNVSTGQAANTGLLGFLQGKQGYQDMQSGNEAEELQLEIQRRQLAEYDQEAKQKKALRQMMVGGPGANTMGGGINPAQMGSLDQFKPQRGLLDSLNPQEKQLGLLALESDDMSGLLGMLQKPEQMQTIDGAEFGRPGELFQMDPATGKLVRVAGAPTQQRPDNMVQAMGPDGTPIFVPEGQAGGMTPYDEPNQPSTSEFERMIATLPPAEQQQARDAYIARQTAPPSGMSIEVGPDGTMRYVQGPGAGMGTAATNTVEDKLINLGEGISRLESIQQQFKPEYQSVWSRLGAAGNSAWEKMGMSLSPEDQASLEEYTLHRRGALDNLNLYIKEITGAAMTNGEAERLTRTQPNVGTGIFDGDSPTEFQAKMDGQMQALRAAETRMQDLRQRGFNQITPELARQYPLENYMQDAPAQVPAGGEVTQTKTIGDKRYMQINGQWYTQ